MKEFMTIPELAKKLDLSRTAVYKKVKKGEIPSQKVGRVYLIPVKSIAEIYGVELTEENKKEIDKAVKKTVKEYGEVLRMLGKE